MKLLLNASDVCGLLLGQVILAAPHLERGVKPVSLQLNASVMQQKECDCQENGQTTKDGKPIP